MVVLRDLRGHFRRCLCYLWFRSCFTVLHSKVAHCFKLATSDPEPRGATRGFVEKKERAFLSIERSSFKSHPCPPPLAPQPQPKPTKSPKKGTSARSSCLPM